MAENPVTRQDREPSEHIAGRVLGILVFLAGIVMLVIAFMLAFQAFHDPNKIISLDQLRATPPPTPTIVYLQAFLRLILLFVMGYLGSLIAARGAQLFFTARRESNRAAAGD
jgi:hypothetical protein